ncbi:MAG: hypothetical protein L6R40_007779 [Gallowayella cf. fulva]|nr:MAG: hypothetical protein L6R40_007779 [Xanthomendoza cf. fulva]
MLANYGFIIEATTPVSLVSPSKPSNHTLSYAGVRVYCRSRESGPLPSIVDCIPTIYHMSMGPGAFMPRTYNRGGSRTWDGSSGMAHCEVAIFGGTTTELFSDDDLLEYVIWMMGRCFPPGNEGRISEVMALIGAHNTWRLQINMKLAPGEEKARGRIADNQNATAKQR